MARWRRRGVRRALAGGATASRHSPDRWARPLLVVAAIGTLTYAGVATWDFSSDELRGSGLAPLADMSIDDGAGDALHPFGSLEAYLPIPAALEDERVIAALGPIADLSCKQRDYREPIVEDTAPAPDLGAEADAGIYSWIDRYATSAALAPLTQSPDVSPASAVELTPREQALAAPLSASESAIDALMTRNLLAAALSPVAALPAPIADTVVATTSTAESNACPALLRHTFSRLQTGESQTLCQFHGKVLVVVNTASYCGYTKQYEGLEALYKKYKDRGLVVVGFPSNDFGNQEPGSNKEIAEFCRTTYGVQFPMFEKSSVARLDANLLYVELAQKTGAAPKWNFHKYVVDRTGTRITSFASDVTPDSRGLVSLIERLLSEPQPASKV